MEGASAEREELIDPELPSSARDERVIHQPACLPASLLCAKLGTNVRVQAHVVWSMHVQVWHQRTARTPHQAGQSLSVMRLLDCGNLQAVPTNINALCVQSNHLFKPMFAFKKTKQNKTKTKTKTKKTWTMYISGNGHHSTETKKQCFRNCSRMYFFSILVFAIGWTSQIQFQHSHYLGMGDIDVWLPARVPPRRHCCPPR